MEEAKLLYKGEEARNKIKNGVRAVSEIVEITLGSHGRNVGMSRDWRGGEISNDGVSVARSIILDDEGENFAAEVFVDVAKRTNEEAGDGTTTAIVLGRAILEEGWKKIGEGDSGAIISTSKVNVMDLKREIFKDKEYVLQELKKQTKKCEKLSDLMLVAEASVENEELGKTIAEIVHKIGKDGFITAEEGYQKDITTEIVEGMKFNGTYTAPFMVTNDRKEAIYEKVDILLTNFEFENPLDLKAITETVSKAGKKALVIFAKSFSKNVLIEMFKAKKAGFHFLAVKIPSLLTDEHDDIAVYTNSRFFDKNQGTDISHATMGSLGFANKIAVNEDEVFLIGGRGSKTEVKAHIQVMKSHQNIEKIDSQKKRVEKRIASMTSGVGIIKVGARSDAERLYLIRKIEDASYATKAALKEGTVKGGGLALKEIAEKMKDGILKNALTAPYDQIQKNAGGELEIPDTILDPVKVTRTALENAVSIAGMLLTTETLIIEKRERKEYEGLMAIANKLNENSK